MKFNRQQMRVTWIRVNEKRDEARVRAKVAVEKDHQGNMTVEAARAGVLESFADRMQQLQPRGLRHKFDLLPLLSACYVASFRTSITLARLVAGLENAEQIEVLTRTWMLLGYAAAISDIEEVLVGVDENALAARMPA